LYADSLKCARLKLLFLALLALPMEFRFAEFNSCSWPS
jgi:hypothetical protein